MVSMITASAHSFPENPGMLDLLCEVGDALQGLRIRALRAGDCDELSVLGFCPLQMRALCEILDRGREKILTRIAKLGEFPDPSGDTSGVEILLPGDPADPVAFLGAYRACCRRLCGALRESLRVSDAATSAALIELTMRLEKQLWLIDAQRNSRGVDDCRSVSLFLAC